MKISPIYKTAAFMISCLVTHLLCAKDILTLVPNGYDFELVTHYDFDSRTGDSLLDNKAESPRKIGKKLISTVEFVDNKNGTITSTSYGPYAGFNGLDLEARNIADWVVSFDVRPRPIGNVNRVVFFNRGTFSLAISAGGETWGNLGFMFEDGAFYSLPDKSHQDASNYTVSYIAGELKLYANGIDITQSLTQKSLGETRSLQQTMKEHVEKQGFSLNIHKIGYGNDHFHRNRIVHCLGLREGTIYDEFKVYALSEQASPETAAEIEEEQLQQEKAEEAPNLTAQNEAEKEQKTRQDAIREQAALEARKREAERDQNRFKTKTKAAPRKTVKRNPLPEEAEEKSVTSIIVYFFIGMALSTLIFYIIIRRTPSKKKKESDYFLD